MYYRRKILLALVEVFGGSLQSADCEKLLFNFCQRTAKNYYDFFPHKYGPFSFVCNYDKRRLVELGLLKPIDDFQLNTGDSYLNQLDPRDRSTLLNFKSSMRGLRGEKLVRKTYWEFPQFSARSQVVEGLFDSEEFKQLQCAWNTDKRPSVFTAGYEGLSIDAFLNKLIANNIALVVDVRSNPQSMKYGFSKKSFRQFIEDTGMKYIHIPELGIPSPMRKGLGETVSHTDLFRTYESKLLPLHEPATRELLGLTYQNLRIALVCFEADYHFCHRHTLVEHLQKDKTFKRTVIHL